MLTINKKFVVDEHGNPKEVIILWEDFRKIEEMLGLDLDSDTIDDLRQARRNRDSANRTQEKKMLSSDYMKVREALRQCKGSLSQDIILERKDRI